MNELVSIPIGWIPSCIGGLGAIIATLAGIIYSSLNARLAAQVRIIERLQGDIDRMSKGCGVKECLWRER
ncbi:hypothetical protein [Luteolibacter marinus]|uniref:hypothetical protein n=1 Tax=Luteolibacter marinus TaxID=2776705 RepID=UPI0018682981|nr:hypothetical protein [Luteolibacter marinus]